jgi:hypothetical protein
MKRHIESSHFCLVAKRKLQLMNQEFYYLKPYDQAGHI